MRYQTGSVRGILAAGILAWAAATPGARVEGQAPRILIDSVAGRDSFDRYCSPCHGKTGRGDGNGGVFPSERVRRIIDGTGVAAHGDRDMPVWGDAFQGGREGLTAEAAKARIDLIVRFLEAIQARAAH